MIWSRRALAGLIVAETQIASARRSSGRQAAWPREERSIPGKGRAWSELRVASCARRRPFVFSNSRTTAAMAPLARYSVVSPRPGRGNPFAKLAAAVLLGRHIGERRAQSAARRLVLQKQHACCSHHQERLGSEAQSRSLHPPAGQVNPFFSHRFSFARNSPRKLTFGAPRWRRWRRRQARR